MYWVYFVIQWFSVLCWSFVGLLFVSRWFLLLSLPLALLRLDHVRVRLRALTCCGTSPTTRKQMVEACKSSNVTLVGQGWHFFLQRKPPSGRVVFTGSFVEPYMQNSKVYYPCGMTIRSLAALFQRGGKAFWSLPSYENISIGAWIADWNHGSQGDRGKPSDYAFQTVDYVSKRTNSAAQVPYSELDRSDIKCILGVSIDTARLNDNVMYEKIAVFVEDDVTEWLQPCVQRVLFIGRKSIGVVWKETKRQAPEGRACCTKGFHVDPRACSRFCLWFQIDPVNYIDRCGCCSFLGCFQEPAKNYNSLVSNYEINRLVPYIATEMTIFTCNTYNYEIFVDLKGKVENTTELAFFNELHQRLAEIRSGRMELRYGSRFLFIDVSLRSGFDRPFLALKQLGITEYALHKGKYQPRVFVEGMRRIGLQEFFTGGKYTKSDTEQDKLRLRF